jgi:hypothetical protein
MPEYPILVCHSRYGDPECWGIVMPVERGEAADLVCNECGVVIATVPAAEVEQTLPRMATEGGYCSAISPHCGELDTFPGFSSMEAYTCRHCGLGVVIQRMVQ